MQNLITEFYNVAIRKKDFRGVIMQNNYEEEEKIKIANGIKLIRERLNLSQEKVYEKLIAENPQLSLDFKSFRNHRNG